MNININLIKELRKRTGMSIIRCKQALIESHGNIELAILNIHSLYPKQHIKDLQSIVTEGIILAKISKNKTYGIIIELNCETDFVSKNNNFREFGNLIMQEAMNQNISDIKILQIKFNHKCFELSQKMGEHIEISRLGVIQGNLVDAYVHNFRIGVILSMTNASTKLIRNIAMQITASNPKYINLEDIPHDIISNEYQSQLHLLIQSGKSESIAKQIVENYMHQFINEKVLMHQPFIMNINKNIDELLREYKAIINKFIRFEIGKK